MSTISFSRVQAALRAMGIDKHEEVTSVVWEPHTVTVTRHALHNGKTYLDDYGDIAMDTTVFTVDYAKDDADTYDGTGLTYADVKLVHDDGVVFDFHVTDQVVYLADVGADSMIDIHLYGKGSASKSSEPRFFIPTQNADGSLTLDFVDTDPSQPMPVGEETPAEPTNHAYTSHGWPCCDQATGKQPDVRARCGTVGICDQCQEEADRIHASA